MEQLRRTLERIRGHSTPRGQERPAASSEAANQDADRPTTPSRPRPAGAKSRSDHRRAAGQRLLHIDLPEWQVAIIDREARALGVSRVGWVRALIANRLRGEPRFTREGELALFEAVHALRAIGQDLVVLRRQYEGDARAPTAAVKSQIARQGAVLDELRAALKAAFTGNLDYWRTPP